MMLVFVIVNDDEKGFDASTGSDGETEIRGKNVMAAAIPPRSVADARITANVVPEIRFLVSGTLPCFLSALRPLCDFLDISRSD